MARSLQGSRGCLLMGNALRWNGTRATLRWNESCGFPHCINQRQTITGRKRPFDKQAALFYPESTRIHNAMDTNTPRNETIIIIYMGSVISIGDNDIQLENDYRVIKNVSKPYFDVDYTSLCELYYYIISSISEYKFDLLIAFSSTLKCYSFIYKNSKMS